MRMIIDTHCHLVSSKYDDMELVRENSIALGVTHCISQGTHPRDWKKNLELAARWPEFVSSCLAVHPTDCTEVKEEDMALLEELCHAYPQAAIGEAGLDYYWNPPEGWTDERYRRCQHELLERHFQLAKDLGLNISIHTRDKSGSACFEDAVAIARQFPGVRPVFHCFIGTQQQAETIFSELDGMLSFTGLITFKKTENVQAVAAWCPADRFMLETDAPFLSPEPFRGHVNIPGRTRYVAEKMAQLRGISLDEVAALTTQNARNFFRLNLSDSEIKN